MTDFRKEGLDEKEVADASNAVHTNAEDHKISPTDDARVRRKIDMVVLPMVCLQLSTLMAS